MVWEAEVEFKAVAGNVRLPGEIDIVAGVEPVTGTVCGEPDALSVAMRLAVAVPPMVGLNVSNRVQLDPAIMDVLQVFVVHWKALASVPEKR